MPAVNPVQAKPVELFVYQYKADQKLTTKVSTYVANLFRGLGNLFLMSYNKVRFGVTELVLAGLATLKRPRTSATATATPAEQAASAAAPQAAAAAPAAQNALEAPAARNEAPKKSLLARISDLISGGNWSMKRDIELDLS